MSDYYHYCSVLYSSCSVVSLVASGSIILTGLRNPRLMLDHRYRLFSYIIWMMSLCDFMLAIAGTLGFPDEHTAPCSIQGVMYLYFLPAQWAWTSMLAYQLKCLIVDKKIHLKVWPMHLICWSIPLINLLSPLSAGMTYGTDDLNDSEAPCGMSQHGTADIKFIFYLIMFCYLFLSIVFQLFMLRHVYSFLHDNGDVSEGMALRQNGFYKALRKYPLALMVINFPLALVFFIIVVHDARHFGVGEGILYGFYIFTIVLQSQAGTIMALIFYYHSDTARDTWIKLLCRWENKNINDDDSNRSRLSSAVSSDRQDSTRPDGSLELELDEEILLLKESIANWNNTEGTLHESHSCVEMRISETMCENPLSSPTSTASKSESNSPQLEA